MSAFRVGSLGSVDVKIKSIQLRHFKQFENFSVSCRDMNVLVGPNNAGKSSVLDAMRVCKDVLRFSRRRNPSLASQSGFGVCATYQIDDSNLNIDTANVVRDYGDEDAEITIKLANANCLTIRLHPDRRTTAFLQTEGRPPKSTAHFRRAFPLDIVVVPTLFPFEAKENFLTDETTSKNEGTRLASRSFRNIWFRKSDEDFTAFNDLVKSAWPDITLQRPTVVGADRVMEMFYEEGRKTREVHWAGFGFQVWLQMMMHIMRGSQDKVLIIDEPDIYLHPDLQRKLTRLIQSSFSQSFIATHSTEVINEVNAGDILSVESKGRNARRISNDEGYRHLFSYIGSSENSEFARMARARRIVFFEGDDRRLLRRFAQKLAKAEFLDDPDTVFLKTGGLGKWRRVTEVGWTLENVFGMKIKVAAVFDRDYRCEEDVESFKQEFNSPEILCSVLERKEIENYALQESALIRTMIKRADSVGVTLTEANCLTIIDKILDGLYDDLKYSISGEYTTFHRKLQPKLHDTTLLKRAMSIFEPAWAQHSRRYELVGGKDFLSALSSALHQKANVSITLAQIVNEMRPCEVPIELVKIISSIEKFFT